MQVTNNPSKAEELLRRAEEVEDSMISSVQASTTSGHFELMGRADAADLMRETVGGDMARSCCH